VSLYLLGACVLSGQYTSHQPFVRFVSLLGLSLAHRDWLRIPRLFLTRRALRSRRAGGPLPAAGPPAPPPGGGGPPAASAHPPPPPPPPRRPAEPPWCFSRRRANSPASSVTDHPLPAASASSPSGSLATPADLKRVWPSQSPSPQHPR